MDFNPMDEQSPLADFWQANDGLDREDATAIASLATQALQSKLGYGYGDDMGVNGQAAVANYTESRSSPQSQYSTTMETEPAESFRGLMEDHDRGAQFSGEDATSRYDLESTVKGRISDDVAGIGEPDVFWRGPNPPDPFHSLLNVAAEVDATDPKSPSHEEEMNATITASHVVNEVLRSSYAAAAQNEVGVSMQTLQSHALQLTPPDSEFPSVSVEGRDYTEQEEDSSISAGERHEGCESENPVVEEAILDIGAQEQLMMESKERSAIDDGKGLPLIRQASEGIEHLLKSDTTVASPDSVPRRPMLAKIAMREKANLEGDAVVESVTVNSIEPNRAEETPTARKRGRPPKSEIPELTPTSAKRGPGRPSKLVASEATGESTPATSKRGRPRKSDVADQTQAPPKEPKLLAVEATATTPTTSKRGRPRRSAAVDAIQVSTNESQPSIAETPTTKKRGRPRKSEVVVDPTQVLAGEPTMSAAEATASTPVLSKRGRPRKSDLAPALTNESQLPIVETPPAATPASSKRGRPPKASVTISAVTPGKRGRPPKSVLPILPAEPKASTTEDKTEATAPSATKATSRQNPSSRQDDALEEQTISPSTIPTKKRGRGRPPKNEALANTIAEPETAADDEEAQPRESKSNYAEIAAENLATDGNTGTEPTQEGIEATPARKRGRPPKSTAADESPLVIAAPVTALVKKRGRPPKAATAESPAKRRGRPSQLEAQETEEPITKRRRTDDDTTMEEAPKEPQGEEAQEDEQSASAQERTVALAANATASKQPTPFIITQRGSASASTTTDLESDIPQPSSQLGRRTRSSREITGAEVPEESAVTEQIEQPVAELLKPTVEIVSVKKKSGIKTYSRRLRR
ncbi:hypothetical protein ACHAQJ_001561 [Trichoderma viride]